jgi:hypothetical protein
MHCNFSIFMLREVFDNQLIKFRSIYVEQYVGIVLIFVNYKEGGCCGTRGHEAKTPIARIIIIKEAIHP